MDEISEASLESQLGFRMEGIVGEGCEELVEDPRKEELRNGYNLKVEGL